MAAALFAAPRSPIAPAAIETAGLLDGAEPPALTAVAPRRAPTGSGRPLASIALALIGIGLLAAGAGVAQRGRVDGSVLARLAPEHVATIGSVRGEPRAGTYGWSAIVDVATVEWTGGRATLHETVFAEGDGDVPRVARGDRVRVEGLAIAPGPGPFATELRRSGMAVLLRVDSFDRLSPSADPIVRAGQRVRSIIGDSIRSILPAREAGLLMGLALGDDSSLDPHVERDFRATGLAHLLVVSGENLAMVLAPLLALAMALRVPPAGRLMVGIAAVAFFVVLTGAEPSVLRAGAMAGLGLAGAFAGRPRSTTSLLGISVLILLLADPSLAWSVGFQLSVAATAGMTVLAAPIAERLGVLPRAVAIAAGATIGAQLGVTPLLLLHFHEVPVVTLLANVLAFPTVQPALVLGITAAMAGIAAPGVGRIVAVGALLPLRALEVIADRLAHASIPWITVGAGVWGPIVGVCVAALLAWRLRSGRRFPPSAVVALIVVSALVVWSAAMSAGPPAGLRIVFLDVGQGDAALVRSPAGATILIDGGPDPDEVASRLSALGVRRLDVVVASHPHADHIVGLPAILSRFPVGLVLDPGCPDTSSIYRNLLSAIDGEGISVRHPRTGESLRVADVRLDVLSPTACFAGTESDANNDALVLRLTCRDDTVLFATEPEEPAQQEMLDAAVPLTAEVLKVPHHGAATSLPAFFQAVHARIAVVSVGPNPYGHPSAATLAEIRATGARIFRTDRVGDITITFDPRGLRVDSAA
jgi:competence protein ComEC